MSETGGGGEDIQVLRDVLLKPLYEQNKVRDQKLVQFVEQFGAKLTTRLLELEKRVDQLTADIDKRENMVSGIGAGIASLGQELRQLASRAESFQVAPGKQPDASAAKGAAEPRQHETVKAESSEPAPQPAQAETDEWDEVEPQPEETVGPETDEEDAQPQEAESDEWDAVEPQPQHAETDEWDEAEAEPESLKANGHEIDVAEALSQKAAKAEDDEAKPRLRKTILRETVQATLPSRGVG